MEEFLMRFSKEIIERCRAADAKCQMLDTLIYEREVIERQIITNIKKYKKRERERDTKSVKRVIIFLNQLNMHSTSFLLSLEK